MAASLRGGPDPTFGVAAQHAELVALGIGQGDPAGAVPADVAVVGATATGTMVASVLVLLFCLAFGLSMDYEVFLLSRIREFWLASARTAADSRESVALGLARTGRVVTAAASLMAVTCPR